MGTAARALCTSAEGVWEPWAQVAEADRIFYMAVTALGGSWATTATAIQPFGGIWAGSCQEPAARDAELQYQSARPRCLLRRARWRHAVADELGVWDLFEVGYRDGQRYGLLAATEDCGPARVTLDEHDLVLISGGGRGIGFTMAEALARRTGCRVIVTGRSPLADAWQPWLKMHDDEFRAFCAERLKAGMAAGSITQAKAELRSCSRAELSLHNLDRVRSAGLRIDYRICDFNNRAEVQALLQSLDAKLTGVIHNAGIDAPVRLAAKTAESFLSTVRTKVAGFWNLIDALATADLKFFCNVGSIAGRLGGMAGQTDYAAGNEGLARLGLWAQSRVKFPVKTVCWTTWNNLGLIANFDTAVKYMTAMDVDEGVARWLGEIEEGIGGEVTFPGHPGRAVSHAS